MWLLPQVKWSGGGLLLLVGMKRGGATAPAGVERGWGGAVSDRTDRGEGAVLLFLVDFSREQGYCDSPLGGWSL